MVMRVRYQPMADVEGHSEAPEVEVEVERMRLETADGAEITLEPDSDSEAEGSWRVVSGPDEVEGHAARIRF